MTLFYCTTDHVRVSSICRQFLWELCPLLELKLLEVQFSALSPTCFDILSWNCAHDFVLMYYRSKFECRQFVSIFVGVMPLLELKILQIHSFPHFSLTCFDILSWNFAYDFVLLYYRSSSSVVNFCVRLCPFWNSEYWKYTVFRTFFWHALTYWAENLHMALFYWNKDQLPLSSICVHFLWELCPFWNFEYLKYAVYFSLTCFGILSWNFHVAFFNVLQIKFECCHSVSIHFIWNLKFDVGFFNAFLLEKYSINIAF